MRPRDLILLGLGLLHAIVTVQFLDPSLSDTDWRCFYESAAAWLRGGDVYTATFRPNFLPPWAVVLMSPLALFGLRGSFAIWTLISLALVISTCRLILKARPEIPWSFLVVSVGSLLPASYVWTHGQWTWVMFACLTRSWLAPTPRQAALWLAPVMMIKPQFLLLAFALPWTIGVPAAIIAVIASAATGPILGVPLWADWWSMRLVDQPMGVWHNVSFVGLASRLQYPVMANSPIGSLTPWVLAACGLTAAAALVGVWRTHGSARWARAWLWAMLVMPLGWITYLPAAAGPILTAATPRTLALVMALLMLPRIAIWSLALTGSAVAFATGCLGLVEVLLLWWAISRRELLPASFAVSAAREQPDALYNEGLPR